MVIAEFCVATVCCGVFLRVFRLARPSLAHHLYRIHDALLLVVVSVAQRRRPGEVLVHISQHGWKCGKRLDARVPGLLIHSLTQGLALQIRMRLHPTVGLDNLLGKRRRRQNLRHKRIGIQRNRRHQLLQLLRSLLGVWRRRRARCRSGLLGSLRRRRSLLRRVSRWRCILIAGKVLRPSCGQQENRQKGNRNLLTQSELLKSVRHPGKRSYSRNLLARPLHSFNIRQLSETEMAAYI